MFTLAMLIAVGVHPTPARTFFDPLAAACQFYAIDSPCRQAAFLAQCAVESAGFTTMEEDLFYRRPERLRSIFSREIATFDQAMRFVGKPRELANFVYANRNGNGDEASGDGWNYRGSGLIEITGLDNFTRCGTDTLQPYAASPALVRTSPSHAALTAAWYWQDRRLNLLADGSLIDLITAKVNPAMEANAQRRQMFDDFMRQFSKTQAPA